MFGDLNVYIDGINAYWQTGTIPYTLPVVNGIAFIYPPIFYKTMGMIEGFTEVSLFAFWFGAVLCSAMAVRHWIGRYWWIPFLIFLLSSGKTGNLAIPMHLSIVAIALSNYRHKNIYILALSTIFSLVKPYMLLHTLTAFFMSFKRDKDVKIWMMLTSFTFVFCVYFYQFYFLNYEFMLWINKVNYQLITINDVGCNLSGILKRAGWGYSSVAVVTIMQNLILLFFMFKTKLKSNIDNILFILGAGVLLNPRMMDYDSFMIGFCFLVYLVKYFELKKLKKIY